ncbi:MAG: helix-turn-helix domain-containing protein [Spirochaetota bacterium]
MIPALKRGLEILKLILMSECPLGYNEILARTRIPPSSVTRLLKSLEEGRYIVKDVNGKYRAGNELLVLGYSTPAFSRLLDRAQQALQTLSDDAENTAILMYWNGREMQSIAKVIHPFSISMQETGTLSSDHSTTPWGALFYLHMDASMQREAERGMSKKKEFLSSLRSIHSSFKKNGYIVEDGFMYRNIRRIAAPVFEQERIVGAVGLGGNTLTIPDERIAPYARLVKNTADGLSLKRIEIDHKEPQ